jgi:hypothetical protein
VSGRRVRRAAVTAALGLGGGVVAVVLVAGGIPTWGVPPLAAVAVLACELAALARTAAPDSSIERSALAGATRMLLGVCALAAAAASLALLAAAIPTRHGVGTGLVGIAAAAALFLLVGSGTRRGERPSGAAGADRRARPGGT